MHFLFSIVTAKLLNVVDHHVNVFDDVLFDYFQDSQRNNATINKKKNKKGFVKNFTNNNLSGSSNVHVENNVPSKPLLERLKDMKAERESYSLYLFSPDDR